MIMGLEGFSGFFLARPESPFLEARDIDEDAPEKVQTGGAPVAPRLVAFPSKTERFCKRRQFCFFQSFART